MITRISLVALVIAGSLWVAPAAWAYSESDPSANPNIDPSNCTSCHNNAAPAVGGTGSDRQGPHGGYTATSNSCPACHQVHNAPADGYLLLPGATMTETCELCHDGTGGKGVYGAIAARGLTVAASHRTEVTAEIPGGDESTGGMATGTLTGLAGSLSCGDCHQPHGAQPVEAITGDRARIATDTSGFVSNQLLRQQPTGATVAVTKYGSDWCAGCHRGRSSGVHDVINHPVDTSATSGVNVFTYENVQRVTGVNKKTTSAGTLGRNNFGYVMPWPRTTGQGTHPPICQQCHEDARNVGDVARGTVSAGEVFVVTTSDGGAPTDNPQFQNFPHESAVANMLLEPNDDLCTNCHGAQQLP